MDVFYWPKQEAFPLKPCACTIGVFDGVHLGHRKIIDSLNVVAAALGLSSVVVTFDPHPAAVVGGNAPSPLGSLKERLELIAEAGTAACVVISFSEDVADMEPAAFTDRFLLGFLGAAAVVVGENSRFGKERRGTAELLSKLGRERDFKVEICPSLVVQGQMVSSTVIRNALLRGKVEKGARMLGRPYRLRGTVVRGAGRGEDLGYPTANIRPEKQLIPANGVYITVFGVESAFFPAVSSIGPSETFGEGESSPSAIETHLLDFGGSLYGMECELLFARRIRDMARFNSPQQLALAIEKDIECAREYFRGMPLISRLSVR